MNTKIKDTLKNSDNSRNKVSFCLICIAALIYVAYIIFYWVGGAAGVYYSLITRVLVCMGWLLVTIANPIYAWRYAKQENSVLVITYIMVMVFNLYVSIRGIILLTL